MTRICRRPALVAPPTDLFFEDFHHNGTLTQGYFYAYPVFGIPRPAATDVARTVHGDLCFGDSLATTMPAEPRAFLEYASDPRKPVPSRCRGPAIEDGTLFRYMSDDQRCFASRADVLTFATDTLAEDVTFAGALAARLIVSTTGTDADFVVKVIDAYPTDEPDPPYRPDTTVHMGGYQQLVRGEIMRGRFRRSFERPAPFVPGEPTEVTVRLQDVFHAFRKGHRIVVQIQSGWFPAFDRNPQRWVPNIYEARERDFVPATHRVWMSRERPSRLEARVLP